LDLHCSQACAKGVVLQRGRCSEQRHDAVAGELVDRPAVVVHDGCAAVNQIGHDLTQAFRIHGRSNVH